MYLELFLLLGKMGLSRGKQKFIVKGDGMWRYQLIEDGNIRLQLVRKLLFDLGGIAERFYLGQEQSVWAWWELGKR